MAKIRTRIYASGSKFKSSQERVTDVKLPANVEIELKVGSKSRKLILVITKEGVYNLGDPDDPRWNDLLSKWE